jgi:hypothetical membrane protein
MGAARVAARAEVPGWALVSSAAAPVLLVGGWTVAAAVQRSSFNAVTETISALAGRGADDRWVMTAALAGVGVCHLATALGLRPLPRAARSLHAVGGLATIAVAAFPLPAGGDSGPHTVAAGAAFASLAAWPAIAVRRTGPAAEALPPVLTAAAAAVLLGLVGWFFAELVTDGTRVGLAERAAAGAQAGWPLVAVVVTRRRQARR